MNRTAYKVIFNKRKGQMDVVSEITVTEGKAASESTGISSLTTLAQQINALGSLSIKTLCLSLMLTLGTAHLVHAQIIADPNAPKNQQATILNTASGATQVNIQTPSAAGVSMNQYRQFDAQSNGTILNNSRTNVQTQTAGWVNANPWLATGGARVIVNQVNSVNPSYLNGSIEVAGQRAEVIIANPAGISVNGASFINAATTTLTTGTPIVNGGNLEGYRVSQGQINIDGQGLDTSQSDYTHIIARNIKLNAGVWAQNLKATTGANQVDATNSAASTIAGTGASPAYALDSSALGGMYANKITFIGTDKGLGINNAGQLAAAAGDVSITADGQLVNSGTINSNGASNTLNIQTSSVTNSGTLSAQGNTHIHTNDLKNTGTVAAGRELKINASTIDNSTGTLNGQRVELNANSLNNTKGKVQQTGSQAIAINANSLSNTNGGLIGYEPASSGTSGTGTGTSTSGNTSSGTSNSSAPTTPSTAAGGATNTVVQPAPVPLADGVINIAGQIDNNAGQITANGGVNLYSKNGLTNNATLNLKTLTVTGNALDNTGGTITTTQANIATDRITNATGKLGSTGNIKLTSNSLTNSKGQITAGGTLNANIAGAVLNDNGVLASAGDNTISANTLDNSSGTMVSSGAGLNATVQGALNNNKGTLNAKSTTINSTALNNDAGLIQGSQAVSINTHGQTLTNTNSGTQAGIVSGGTLNVQTGDLNNTATGYIGSTGAATLSTAQLNNAGDLSSGAGLDISATGLDNRTGQIQAVGDAHISVGTGTVNNDASLIRSSGHTTINAAHLINSNTNTSKTGIESHDLTLNVSTIDNSTGALRADGQLSINSSGTLNNSKGLVTSAQGLNIQDAQTNQTLAITNTSGTLIAGQSNTIRAKSLTGDGQVLSNQDMNMTLVDDFTNNAKVQATGNLSISSVGNVNNNAQITAGQSNTVSAQNINNAANAEISGKNTTLNAVDTVSNRGLIDGSNTLITAQTVNNIGTGRVYGNHLSIGATTLNNRGETLNGTTSTGTIAARERLDIGANTINNLSGGKVGQHSIIFSGDSMHIGAALDVSGNATGQAAVLNNQSSTVESLGDMSLAVAQIYNTNEHFTTKQEDVSKEHIIDVVGTSVPDPIGISGYATPTGPSQTYRVDPDKIPGMPDFREDMGSNNKYLLNSADNVYVINDQSNYLATPEGAYSNWDKRDYTRTTNETVVATTDAAKITAGGNLSIHTNELLNDNSQIVVGGTLSGDADKINNKETLGTSTVTDNGGYVSYWRDHDKGRDETWSNLTENRQYLLVHPSQTINVSTASVQTNTVPTGSGTTINGLNTGSVTESGAGGQAANVNNSVYSTSATNPTLIKSGAINTAMPNSSLFSVNPNHSAYLIQTDPKFASYRNWLGSDYMLNALSLDPTTMHKRLGDGYYEQKLIREQIAQLTGRRYIDGQTNDDEQYKALMNAGVTFAGQYSLRPGVALTAEQMARLTSDIVWLVEQVVTLPDGTTTTVLVPKVYVAVKPGDIDGSGALISANSINLKLTGDLNNSGTIAGRNVTQITAENINNQGRLTANQLDLNARTDLNNIGGVIDANTSATIKAGRDVNVVSTTVSANNNFGSETIIDRVAGIYVGDGANKLIAKDGASSIPNTLTIEAGRNVNLTAADMANDGVGQTSVTAGNDLNLNTAQVGSDLRIYRDEKNGYSINEIHDVGTSIYGVGNVKLKAGNDLNATAANVNSELGNLVAQAGHDVNIGVGQTTRSTKTDNYSEDNGPLSSTKTTTHTESDSRQSIASNFTGDKVLIGAGNDYLQKGSTVVGLGDVSIQAGHDASIVSSTDTYHQDNSQEVKKKGFTGGYAAGVLSVGYGKSQAASQSSTDSTTQAASTTASLYGNTTIKAGNHLQVIASDLGAGENLTLVAKDIDLTAAQNTLDEHNAQQSKSSGFSVGLTVNPVDAFKSAYTSASANTPATGTVGKIGKVAEGVGSGLKAATTAVVITAGSQKSSANQDHHVSEARTSSLTAGNNLTVMATDGNIDSQGTQMSAEGNALLLAKHDINLDVAHNYETQTSNNKASGWSFDNRLTGLPMGVFKNKGNGDGATDTVTGTQLSVGGTSTLATTQGDITLTGANIVANGDVNLNAARNLTIQSAQDTVTNENHSNNKAIGKVVVSDTERFMGYHNEKHNDNNTAVTQVASNVGSLGGKVNLKAGNAYTQTASNVVAAQDINVTAKTIDINTADNTGSSHVDDKAVKVGVFARVTSPLIDLVNNVEAAQQSDGRLKSLQNMAAASNGVQAVAAAVGQTGALFKAEAGIGFATANSNEDANYQTAQGSTLSAGRHLNLTSTEGDIHATGAILNAGKTLSLDSANDIVLDASQDQASASGQHSNYGAEIGIGYQVGKNTGPYIYGQAGYGQGKYEAESTRYNNTHLSGETINLKSAGDTTLKGADAHANTINADVGGKLAIESVQDTATQYSKDTGASARVEVGYTFANASGSYNQAKASGSFTGVNQQSGLFAGDGGYHVKADSVDLKGGAITSTHAANSSLSTNALTFSNLDNSSSYQTSSTGANFSTDSSIAGNVVNNLGNIVNMMGNGKPTNASSTTYATLTEGNIHVGGTSTSAAATGIHTDAATAHQALEPLPDVRALMAQQQAEAAAVNTISQGVAIVVSNVISYAANSAKGQVNEAAAALETAQASGDAEAIATAQANWEHASSNLTHWQPGGLYAVAANAVSTIAVGLAAEQDPKAIAASMAAPLAANAIGDLISEDNKAAKFAAHAVSAGLIAALGGADTKQALAAGLATGLTESLIAPAIVKDLYGKNSVSELSNEQRETVLALSGVAGAIIAGIAGDSSTAAAFGATGALNAVQNNALATHTKPAINEIKACMKTASPETCIDNVKNKYANIDYTFERALADACSPRSASYNIKTCASMSTDAAQYSSASMPIFGAQAIQQACGNGSASGYDACSSAIMEIDLANIRAARYGALSVRANSSATDNMLEDIGQALGGSAFSGRGGVSARNPNAKASKSQVNNTQGLAGRYLVDEGTTTRGMVVQSVPDGTKAMAIADFNAMNLTNVSSFKTASGATGYWGETFNGTRVTVRDSQDGQARRWTIQFSRTQNNGAQRTTREVRYGAR
ncbi:hemagglutinin repeat-containing protein [Hydromonas duriensis]|uniref:Filamentous hemagglutinin n=1 Tax=Hydromonas duriensis TaxID=1527608 RepID=A0A4R6Y4H8_9BURK|nr:hemagglutinin repeat-containing protein [Hydromonas duriensis]TDR28910.1 filamentous hemagglutinin [Hydromonas duriensis]